MREGEPVQELSITFDVSVCRLLGKIVVYFSCSTNTSTHLSLARDIYICYVFRQLWTYLQTQPPGLDGHSSMVSLKTKYFRVI